VNEDSASGTGSLGPDERLKRRPEFQAVFDEGRRTHGRFMTILVRANRLARARLGVVATRKLGGAVERNRAKRLIRHLFRTHKSDIGRDGQDIVVIPRRELLDAAFSAIEADYKSSLVKHFRSNRGRGTERDR